MLTAKRQMINNPRMTGHPTEAEEATGVEAEVVEQKEATTEANAAAEATMKEDLQLSIIKTKEITLHVDAVAVEEAEVVAEEAVVVEVTTDPIKNKSVLIMSRKR